jgi:hypothetical protein
MKKIIFLSLIFLLIIVSCSQEKKSPIEGAWQMIYGNWQSVDTTFPAQIKGSQIKILSKEYFAFVGHFELDTIISENYGGGTYKLEGDRFEEGVIYHASKASIGKKVKLLVEIRNDTLIQRWPADENWKLAEKYSTEKYVRLK